MVNIVSLVDFILHVDKYIAILLAKFGVFTYIILFGIVFCETGLVITPFLPGDSLLFVVGTFAAKGAMKLSILFFVCLSAAIIGDSTNYWIGRYLGEKAFANNRFFHREYLEKAKEFYRRHGGKTVIMARFVPIVRTFAPFVAGLGEMRYPRFLTFSIIGNIIWVSLFLVAGYFFGELPFVEENLTLVIFGIIFLSFLPPIIEFIRHKRRK
jgi:membrane-associated protein